jgi:hypothetical protein
MLDEISPGHYSACIRKELLSNIAA